MQQLAANQDNAHVLVNENFATLDWATAYGNDPDVISPLHRGYLAGRWGGFVVAAVDHTFGTSVTTYVSVVRADGTLDFSTSSSHYLDAANYARVETVVTDGSGITTVTDDRGGPGGVHGGGGGSAALADGDYGDIVVSGTGTGINIDSSVLSTFGRTLTDDANAAAARTTLGLGNVDNTADASKPVSTAQAAADAAVLAAAETYADGLVVGLWDDRGSFDASGGAFPTSGGSGSAGAIKKGDIWTISVAGTLGGHAVGVGDTIRAIVDTPGSTDANWAKGENNIGYVPENAANKDASGGYAGLTLFKLNLRNAANTITSWFTTAATVARTWTLPDKDGTVAMTSDITGANSGTNTGDETAASIATIDHGVSTKSAMVDADEMNLLDSAASFALKRFTFTNVKAFFKTYFDTLYLALGGGTLSGALNEAPAVTIASSTTPAIFAAAGNTINMTGTVTVTGFDTIAAGAVRRVIFGGILQLTYNATLMQNITAANITTAAGDVAEFESLGSGNTKMLSYTRKDGTALVGSGTFTGGTLTSALNEAPPATIASAGTVNIGAAAANTINISGTTTITAFDTIAAGAIRCLIFGGALTLTHNATSLILPGAANITTAANDCAFVQSLGSGNWICIAYQKANGQAVVSSGGSNVNSKLVSATYTRPADTTTYTAGDVFCNSTSAPTILSFANFASTNGGGAIIKSAQLVYSTAPTIKPDVELWLFDTTVTMQNDNAAWNPSDGEMLTCVGKIYFPTGNWVVAGANMVNDVDGLEKLITCTGASTTIFGIPVIRNPGTTFVPAASDVMTPRLQLIQTP